MYGQKSRFMVEINCNRGLIVLSVKSPRGMCVSQGFNRDNPLLNDVKLRKNYKRAQTN